jgi:hypothetical protein
MVGDDFRAVDREAAEVGNWDVATRTTLPGVFGAVLLPRTRRRRLERYDAISMTARNVASNLKSG